MGKTESTLVRNREQIIRSAPGRRSMPILMDTHALATWLQVRTGWLDQLRFRGEGPPYTKIRGIIRYHQDDVIAWLRAKRIDPEADRKRLAG